VGLVVGQFGHRILLVLILFIFIIIFLIGRRTSIGVLGIRATIEISDAVALKVLVTT
jgi:hypothetical protein